MIFVRKFCADLPSSDYMILYVFMSSDLPTKTTGKNPSAQDLGLETFAAEAPFFVLRAPRPALEQVVEVPPWNPIKMDTPLWFL